MTDDRRSGRVRLAERSGNSGGRRSSVRFEAGPLVAELLGELEPGATLVGQGVEEGLDQRLVELVALGWRDRVAAALGGPGQAGRDREEGPAEELDPLGFDLGDPQERRVLGGDVLPLVEVVVEGLDHVGLERHVALLRVGDHLGDTVRA